MIKAPLLRGYTNQFEVYPKLERSLPLAAFGYERCLMWLWSQREHNGVQFLIYSDTLNILNLNDYFIYYKIWVFIAFKKRYMALAHWRSQSQKKNELFYTFKTLMIGIHRLKKINMAHWRSQSQKKQTKF